jgi:hypothetical protein
MKKLAKSLSRRIGLSVPPIRRLYHGVAALEADHRRLQADLKASLGEMVDVKKGRENLQLDLYALRSDLQRAAARNEELASRLRRAVEQAAAAEREAHAARSAQEAQRELASQADVTLATAKVLGSLTVLASEVSRLRPSRATGGAELYLDLLEVALTGVLSQDPSVAPWGGAGYDPEIRAIGHDWPATAQTMIGAARVRNLRVLSEQVLSDGVPGDFLEAGVWRGGACILMRGVLAAHSVDDRTVWVADSFEGLPEPDPKYPADAGDIHSTFTPLKVSADEVRGNFNRYGLLDDQVKFLEGWFEDTLPSAPIEQLALLRLDGDMYSSTIQTLDALYAKVSPGGAVIVDDYILPGCRKAVDDFRERHDIVVPLVEVDGAAVYWRKS